MSAEARFRVGQQYWHNDPKFKVRYVCTIVDIYKTYNSAGELVKLRYVASHDFLGQKVVDYDVVDTTIARNLI